MSCPLVNGGEMGRLTTWWCGRRLAPRQQRRQKRHSHGVGTWRLQGGTVGISLLLLALIVPAAHGQRLTLTPSLSIGERYDDNIFQTRTNTTDDFITILSPGIRVQYLSTEPTPETRLDFDYRADVEWFADNSSQDQVAHRASLTFASQLAPSLTVHVRDLFLVTDEPFDRDERLGDPTGLRPRSLQGRARTLRNQAKGTLDVRLGGRTALGMLFESLIDDVDIPEELDEFRYTVGAELGYVVNVARDSRVLVAYQVTFHTFRDNGVVLPGNSDAPFQAHTVSTGWRHELTPTLAVNAALGYSFTNSDEPQNDGHKAVVANVGLIKTFNIGQASLGYARKFISGEGTGGVVLADTVSAGVAINLTGKLTARLDTNVSWFDFQSATVRALDRVFWSVRPNVTYQILRPWSVTAGYAYELTDFTDDRPGIAVANRADHRLLMSTQFALREWLLLGLSYRYSSRLAEGNSAAVRAEEFSRNQVMLTLTASPDLRF